MTRRKRRPVDGVTQRPTGVQNFSRLKSAMRSSDPDKLADVVRSALEEGVFNHATFRALLNNGKDMRGFVRQSCDEAACQVIINTVSLRVTSWATAVLIHAQRDVAEKIMDVLLDAIPESLKDHEVLSGTSNLFPIPVLLTLSDYYRLPHQWVHDLNTAALAAAMGHSDPDLLPAAVAAALAGDFPGMCEAGKRDRDDVYLLPVLYTAIDTPQHCGSDIIGELLAYDSDYTDEQAERLHNWADAILARVKSECAEQFGISTFVPWTLISGNAVAVAARGMVETLNHEGISWDCLAYDEAATIAAGEGETVMAVMKDKDKIKELRMPIGSRYLTVPTFYNIVRQHASVRILRANGVLYDAPLHWGLQDL